MNDADRGAHLPDVILFQSYIERMIDHLTFCFDPKATKYFYQHDDIPQIFADGQDMMEFAKDMIPKTGEIKNCGYLPFFIYFVAFYRYGVKNFGYPEGDNYITPENIGDAVNRFPSIHGIYAFSQLYNSTGYTEIVELMQPLNSTGDIQRTCAKYQMAKIFDLVLDNSNVNFIPYYNYYRGPEADYYKITDMYCVWNIKTFHDGELWRELDSATRDVNVYGSFGWLKNDANEWINETMRFRLKIHSASEFRYKYVVICATSSYQKNYGGCDYDFVKTNPSNYPYSVIYESPGWCLGDSVFEYDFVPGDIPADGEEAWQVIMTRPGVIIYPEYPDRLKELLEQKTERN